MGPLKCTYLSTLECVMFSEFLDVTIVNSAVPVIFPASESLICSEVLLVNVTSKQIIPISLFY